MTNFTPSTANPLVATLQFELRNAGPTLRDLKRFVEIAESLGAEESEMLTPLRDRNGEQYGIELLFEVK